MNTLSDIALRSIRRLAITVIVLGAILFLSAGSMRFWEAWFLLSLQAGFWTFFLIEFLRRDPQLLERRLKGKETEPEQKWFQRLWSGLTIVGLALVGLDFRFGWTRRTLGPIPVALVLTAQVFVVMGYWFIYWVMRTNAFAGSTIRVEAEQTVIDRGPYALVRHPMYLGLIVTMLAVPVALGSYVTVPLFVLLVPTLIFRLVHEERTLRQHLRGYAQYCVRTPYRLVPWIW
jgi:protein-S-isoprenylcysteine O-methyltransferase Ste14